MRVPKVEEYYLTKWNDGDEYIFKVNNITNGQVYYSIVYTINGDYDGDSVGLSSFWSLSGVIERRHLPAYNTPLYKILNPMEDK